jgi:uncharacterized protein YbjT (DUF2867 family)
MSEGMLVIGATGRVGSELVRLLRAKGVNVRAATRTPNQPRSKLAASVEAVEFDFERPGTFVPALKEVDRVFLMARPGDNRSDKAAMPFIDAAKQEGIRHIVNLTAMGVEQDGNFMLRVLESYLEASGIPYTHLRPNWFMQNFDSGPMFADIRATGALHLPAASAKLSFIDLRDVAAVALAALTEPIHAGKANTLTGSAALDHFEAVRHISRVAGKTISYVPISEEAAKAGLAKSGIPEEYIRRWTAFFEKVRQGLCAPVTQDVENVLGRPAIPFARYAEDYAPAWR